MGKRHQANRRKSYGRRQHEIRERLDRPHATPADIAGIRIFNIDAYDAPPDDPFGAFDRPGSRAGVQFALGK